MKGIFSKAPRGFTLAFFVSNMNYSSIFKESSDKEQCANSDMFLLFST